MIDTTKKLISSTVNNPFFAGSAIMIVGSNFANLMAYIYHLVIGRMLDPENYGELVAVLSLVGMISAAFTFAGAAIVRFVSKSNEVEVSRLFRWFVGKAYILGVITFILIIALSPFIKNFLKLPLILVLIAGPITLFSVVSFVYKSFLQGLLEFKKVVYISSLEMILRLVLGVVFVYVGFSSFGAVTGVLIGVMGGYLLGKMFFVGEKYKAGALPAKTIREIFKYSAPLFLSSLALTSFYTTDILLVKHFFGSHDAGLYSAISTLGKVVFFGSVPVSAVMFPLVSKKHSRGEAYGKIFFASLLLTAAIALGVSLVFKFFPGLSLEILFGSKYLSGSSLLFDYAVFISFYTLASLIVNLYFSIGKTVVVWFPVFFSLFQIIGITVFHSSLTEVIKVSSTSSILLFIVLLLYFRYESSKAFSKAS